MDLLSKNDITWVDDTAWSDGTQLAADGTLKAAPAESESGSSHVLLLDTKDRGTRGVEAPDRRH
jgi:hypothetical protein